MPKVHSISNMKHSMTYKDTKCYTALYHSNKPSGYGIKVQVGKEAMPYPLQHQDNGPIVFDSKESALCAAKDYVREVVDI